MGSSNFLQHLNIQFGLHCVCTLLFPVQNILALPSKKAHHATGNEATHKTNCYEQVQPLCTSLVNAALFGHDRMFYDQR